MPSLSVNGGRIHYQIHGEGEPIVLLKGLGHSIEHWLGFDQLLAKNYQVIAIDHRGIGFSEAKVSWDLTLYDLAEDVLKVINHLDILHPHFLGNSMGGMVSLAFAVKFPERCRSLIAINSSIGGQKSLRINPKVVGNLLRHASDKNMSSEILTNFLVDPNCNPLLKKQITEQWRNIESEGLFSNRTILKHLLAIARFQLHSRVQRLDNPALLVYGENDQFVPIENSLKLHRAIQKAQLAKIPGAGHEVSIDKPNELLGVIRAFTGKY